MNNEIIKLGVYYNGEGNYSFDIIRINNPTERISWSQTPQGLGDDFYMTFLIGEQSGEEYSNAKRIEVIPIKGIGTRPARPSELGELIISIAEHIGKDVLLHTKPKRLEEIK